MIVILNVLSKVSSRYITMGTQRPDEQPFSFIILNVEVLESWLSYGSQYAVEPRDIGQCSDILV